MLDRTGGSLGRSSRFRLGVSAVGVALVMALTTVPAGAQEAPDLPDAEIPEPVRTMIQDAINTVASELTAAAIEAGPAVEAVGFALRPACAVAGTAFVVVVVAGGAAPLPFNVVPLSGPLFVVCSFSFSQGPLDAVFDDADAVVGPTLEQELQPILNEVGAGLEPARGELGEVCGNAALFSSAPSHLPPPLSRFDYVAVVCG